MTTHHVVTTCHKKGWTQYGRRMIKTLQYYWPADTHLTLYAEDFTPDLPLKDVRALPVWQQEFKLRHAQNPRANGVMVDRPYNLLFDAVRFSHKVGAVVDAMGHSKADTLIWVDADVVTHTSVQSAFLDSLLQPGMALAWLNRVHKYPECGFVVYDRHHPVMARLMNEWAALYMQDTLFKLQHWTDCHSLEHVVKEIDAPWCSLSGRYTNVGHPFINGPLGAVMDHLKGNRKSEGRSRRIDLRQRRQEQYWRNAR